MFRLRNSGEPCLNFRGVTQGIVGCTPTKPYGNPFISPIYSGYFTSRTVIPDHVLFPFRRGIRSIQRGSPIGSLVMVESHLNESKLKSSDTIVSPIKTVIILESFFRNKTSYQQKTSTSHLVMLCFLKDCVETDIKKAFQQGKSFLLMPFNHHPFSTGYQSPKLQLWRVACHEPNAKCRYLRNRWVHRCATKSRWICKNLGKAGVEKFQALKDVVI